MRMGVQPGSGSRRAVPPSGASCRLARLNGRRLSDRSVDRPLTNPDPNTFNIRPAGQGPDQAPEEREWQLGRLHSWAAGVEQPAAQPPGRPCAAIAWRSIAGMWAQQQAWQLHIVQAARSMQAAARWLRCGSHQRADFDRLGGRDLPSPSPVTARRVGSNSPSTPGTI